MIQKTGWLCLRRRRPRTDECLAISVAMWGMPIVIGIMSAVGVLSALLGDGIWDVLSWVALAAPVAVLIRHVTATFW